MKNPLIQIEKWWSLAIGASPLNLKSAVCLSTIDETGFPNSRFVDLKDVDLEGVIFCSSYDSKKGGEIKNNPRVGITAWWDHVGYQIRIVGNAVKVSEGEAIRYWEARSRSAQVATLSFNQSQILDNFEFLEEKFLMTESEYKTNHIPKPVNWGAYKIVPNSIEFLQFKENRIHHRELYQIENGKWSSCLLQP
ncbi:MAG: pyridoxamine 5'-phosphate oxidase [Gammaproteobacteria bacterium]|nr:MAG: pyridoxamine 5'-phosphate oxidase [Gammaproteobacteria bacterium]